MRISWVVLAVAFASTAMGAETPPQARAEAVYAAFTVNLTRFISWPEGALGPAGAPFVIGTFARDPINPDLEEAARGEMVGTHPVRMIRLRSVADATKCQLVFVSDGAANLRALLSRIGHRPILSVSDASEFLTLGGHVMFVPRPPHTRLEISADNLRASGLEARAQLLRIAASP